MIQLKLAPRPIQLTNELVIELTQKFLSNNKERVWNRPFIIDTLMQMSSNKCCYCECKLDKESNYMEVEHFLCKSLYPNEVINWINLLPSCKRCNGKKLNHDTKTQPIIHPVDDNPKAHLAFRAYRFYGTTVIGKETVEVVRLNERNRLQNVRFAIGSKVKEKLDELEIQMKEYLSDMKNLKKRNQIIEKLRGIMLQGQPSEEYAATVATEIIREDSYHFVKQELEKLDYWDSKFQDLEDKIQEIAY